MTILGLAQSVNSYEYDNLNRLTKTTYSNGTVVQYTYDALGRRLRKQMTGVSVIYTITATANPSNGGAVSGAGTHQGGSTCVLSATANTGYSFVNWTENGSQVSTNPTYSFTVSGNRALEANFTGNGGNSGGTGALNGVFSVSDNLQVNFSQGNLQYQASTNTWRFATNQYDYIGSDNSNISETYSGWIDLFGWGTSGYNHGAVCYQPWSTSTTVSDYCAYGSSNYNLYDQTGQADWGYNAISNGGGQENQWRCLTRAEWMYLFDTRSTTSGIRYAKAMVNGINGVILLPDNWSSSTYTLNNTNDSEAGFNSNEIDAFSWTGTLQPTGAVFIPAAGRRNSVSVSESGNSGYYWSSSVNGSNPTAKSFDNTSLPPSSGILRKWGCSVRLVLTIEPNTSYSIEATPNPAQGGTITGVGFYEQGQNCTLTATANSDYTFSNWAENGTAVSTNSTYSFTVTGNRTLVANFSNNGGNSGGMGALNGAFSVSDNLQVNFSQGNLQYQASTNTWRFATNQYDYIGNDNSNISEIYSGWIDLFGWGTSGYNHGAVCYQPWSASKTNSDYYAYGSFDNNLYEFTGIADWGYNAISNGGNQENYGWRTLTKAEWSYLFNTRNTPSGIRFVKAVVNGCKGMIVLPDDWNVSKYNLNNTNDGGADYSGNTISLSDWATSLESNGAVFLPANGYRNGTSISGAGENGSYWSSTNAGTKRDYKVYFDESSLTQTNQMLRYGGLGVRLVIPVDGTTFNVSVMTNGISCGTVDGDGICLNGSTCSLTLTPNYGYSFVNWTENGKEVSTSPNYSFVVRRDRDLVANFTSINGDGRLNGVFSVGESSLVSFSHGNLQYKASTNTWRFAINQYDYVGWKNENISSNNDGWIDLFGWGTSGYNHGGVCYQPWGTSLEYSDYFAYGMEASNLYDQTGQADWGCNVISNGGNTGNYGWRTMTDEEWQYVLNTRVTASGIRFAKATVNGVKGVVLLPDDWSASIYGLNNTNESGASFLSNVITLTDWIGSLEVNGAVFLSAAGYREQGAKISGVGAQGWYWSSTYHSNAFCMCLCFYDNYLSNTNYDRNDGLSVRLVKPVSVFSVNATANPAEGGEVSGGGTYAEGTDCTLTATANTGYDFTNWTENGEVVSTEATYSFTVSGDRELVANFALSGPITNHWTPIGGTQYNMTVKGIIVIDGVTQANDQLEIGAFCGDECRGSRLASVFPLTGEYTVMLTLVSNTYSGETITFRIYDHGLGQELDLHSQSTLTFEHNTNVGALGNWYPIAFTSAVTVTTPLTQGWNWWSTYIEQGNIQGLTMLEESLGHNGLTIKSQNAFTDNYYQSIGEDYWYGSLESINNEQGYLINVSGDCGATMTGAVASPSDHPITICPNWNWIGYPVASAQNVTTALLGFTPSVDDVLKGQSAFTSYYEGYGWYPDDFVLEPGRSYLYCSNATGNKTLMYPEGSRGWTEREAVATHWKPDVHSHAGNIVVTATVTKDGMELEGDHVELGAFVNGECRGTAQLRHFGPTGRWYAMLTVTG
ncbi:MAG: hypothetical protein J6P73_00945, partial [Bacteroidales bacterium]|nr:hypothetical protein [Bacteroidales bacterium]